MTVAFRTAVATFILFLGALRARDVDGSASSASSQIVSAGFVPSAIVRQQQHCIRSNNFRNFNFAPCLCRSSRFLLEQPQLGGIRRQLASRVSVLSSLFAPHCQLGKGRRMCEDASRYARHSNKPLRTAVRCLNIDGETLGSTAERSDEELPDLAYFSLFKPDGYLSQFVNNEQRRKQKQRLLSDLEYDFPNGTMAVGRLDQHSEGLLLLTTDGKFSYEVTGSSSVEKEYLAQVDGDITEEAIQVLTAGEISIGLKYGKQHLVQRPISVHKLSIAPELPPRQKSIRDARHGPTSWISITLIEGKFRQVRKMTAAVGFPTLRLVRIRIGRSPPINGEDCGLHDGTQSPK